MTPTIGRIVHYKLKEGDAPELLANGLKPGDTLPAVIVRVQGDQINLKVLTDWTIDVWLTGIPQGDDWGQWNWPVKVE